MAIFIGGTINAEAVLACQSRDIPFVLVEVRPNTLREMSGGWFRARNRPLLDGMRAGFSIDAVEADALRSLCAPDNAVHAFGPLEQAAPILPCDDEARRTLSAKLSNRPVWLARGIALTEVETLVAAHRHAARRSHRLLLCVTLVDPVDSNSVISRFSNSGFETALRSGTELPDEPCQVLIIDRPEEDGLWLRLAQITFAGGTLTTGARHDPFEAAALGSVVVHGLQTHPHLDRFRRLMRAGASLGISDPGKLGAAVETLLAPDRAAGMAVAGWDMTSTGAEVGNRIITLIQDRIGEVGG